MGRWYKSVWVDYDTVWVCDRCYRHNLKLIQGVDVPPSELRPPPPPPQPAPLEPPTTGRGGKRRSAAGAAAAAAAVAAIEEEEEALAEASRGGSKRRASEPLGNSRAGKRGRSGGSRGDGEPLRVYGTVVSRCVMHDSNNRTSSLKAGVPCVPIEPPGADSDDADWHTDTRSRSRSKAK